MNLRKAQSYFSGFLKASLTNCSLSTSLEMKGNVTEVSNPRNQSQKHGICLDKIYFMHINKTAGKSIEEWFALNNTPIVGAKEDACQDVIRKFDRKGFYFTVVRNPYSRIVSQYLHWRDNLQRLKEDVSFRDYILNLDNPSFFVQEEYLHLYQKRFHMPCDYWIRRDVFRVFKFEKIHEVKNFFMESLGFKDNFPHINTTSKVDVMSYFDADTLKVVNTLMKADFHRFRYEMKKEAVS